MRITALYKPWLLLPLLAVLIGGCQSNATKTSSTEPMKLSEQISLADRLLAQGKEEAALAEYHLALELEPRNSEILARLAYLYDRLGDTTATENVLRDLVVVDPDNAAALEKLGLLELKRGQREAAGQRLDRAKALGRTSWKLFNGLGVLADYQGDYQIAREHYASGLQQKPTHRALLLNNIGYSHYLAGELLEALALFNKALAVDPKFNQALSNKGLTLIRMDRSTDALHVFRGFMSEEKALNNVGFLNMLFNNYRLAEQYFRMAIKSSPVYYKEAHENLEHLRQLRQSDNFALL